MFLIDYFSFTISSSSERITLEDVVDLLGLNEYITYFLDIGAKSRYEHCYKMGNMNILLPYDNRSDMGIFINFTGQGCREYEDCFISLYNYKNKENAFKNTYEENCKIWHELFKKIIRKVNLGYKVNITRIDLAFDDFNGLLDLEIIQNKLLRGEYVSRFRKWSEIECQSCHSKKGDNGRTIYIGSKKSNCYCKFYDKLTERKQANKDDEYVMEKLNELSHWVRFEITFKDNLAIFIVSMIYHSSDYHKEISDYINKCLRFIDMTATRAENCCISSFWSEFIQSHDISKYSLLKSDLVGYDKVYLWFKKSLAPSMFALLCTYKDPMDFFQEIVYNGAFRLNDHHRQIIDGKTMGKKFIHKDIWEMKLTNKNEYVDIPVNIPIEEETYKPFR